MVGRENQREADPQAMTSHGDTSRDADAPPRLPLTRAMKQYVHPCVFR